MPFPKKYASQADRQKAYRGRCKQARKIEQAARGLPALPAISTMPGKPRWNASLAAAHELLSCTLSEMQDYFDERSEAWQEGERAEEHQERIDSLQAVLDNLDEITL